MSGTGPKILVESRILKGTADSVFIAHVSGTGADHTFINQDVTTTATPTFAGVLTDSITESTGGAGVSICGTNNRLLVDELQEKTGSAGITINSTVDFQSTTEFNAIPTFNTNVDMNSNLITNLATPVSSTDAATRGFVESVATGLDWKDSVRAGTVVAGTLATDFENGDTIDGVLLATGDRILIKDQASGVENGIYTVNASGAPTRTSDYDTGSNAAGTVVTVEEGTSNADRAYICTNDQGSDTVGTDSLSFSQFGGISITAGDGIDLTGNVISVDVSDIVGAGVEDDGANNIRISTGAAGDGLIGGGGSALAVGSGDGITVNANDVQVNVTDFAGTGLEGDGSNNLRIAAAAAGDGLSGGGGSALAVSVSDIAGTGLEDDGSNNLRIAAAAAGDGLSGGGGSALAVSVSDIAGTGLEDDGSNNLRIAAAAAGNNLTGGGGSALSVNLTSDTYYVTTTTEFNDAVTAIGISGNASRILLAPGTFSFTGSVTIPSDCIIEGSSRETTIVTRSSAFSFFTLGGDNITIKSLTIDSASENARTLSCVGRANIYIVDCDIINATNASTTGDFEFTTSSANINISNCAFDTASGASSLFYFDTCNEVTFSGCYYTSIAKSFVHRIQTVDNVKIIGCTAATNTSGGNFFDFRPSTNCIVDSCTFSDMTSGTAVAARFSTSSSICVTNCVFNDIFVGVSLDTANDVTVSNNAFTNTAFTQTAIRLRTIDGGSVCGNTVSGSLQMDIGNNTASTNLSIVGNSFSDIQSQSGIIVQLSSAGLVSIVGNTIENTGTVAGRSCIRIATPTGSNIIVEGNTCVSSTATVNDGNIFVSGTSSDFVKVINNNTTTNRTLTGSHTINGYDDYYLVDANSRTGDVLTLPDISLASAGHKIYIELDAGAGNFTLTPTNFKDGTSVVFDANGEYMILEWNGSEWESIESNFYGVAIRETIHYVDNLDDLTRVVSLISGTGGKIVVGPGTFSLSSAITLPDSTILIGSGIGSTIFEINNAAMTEGINTGSDCLISGITVDGNANGTVSLIKTTTDTDVTIENCEFIGGTGTDVYGVHVTNGSDRVTVYNCNFNTFGETNDTGIWVDADGGSANGLVQAFGCKFITVQFAFYCADTSEGDENIISGCYFTAPALGFGNVLTLNGRNATVTNCIFYDWDGSATDQLLVRNATFTNNYIDTCTGAQTVCDFRDCSVSGNIFDTLNTAIDSDNCSITGNTFRSCTTGIINGVDSNITGNFFVSTTTGFQSDSGSGDETVVSGNYFESSTRGVYILNASDTVVISNNLFKNCTTGIEVGVSIASSSINSNLFTGSYTRGIYFSGGTASFGGSTTVTGNTFENAGSATEIIDTTADDGTGLIVHNNSALISTASITGTINVPDYVSHYVITAQNNSGGSLVLPDLITGAAGTKFIVRIAGLTSGSFSLTPTSFSNGTSLLLDTDEDNAILEWTGSEWRLIENGTGNTPTETITLTNVANTSARATNEYRIDTIGNETTFTASFAITPTASATTTSFRFTLPRRTTITNNFDIMGTAVGYDNTNDVALENLFVRGDATNNEGFCQFTSNGSGSADHIITVYAKYTVN